MNRKWVLVLGVISSVLVTACTSETKKNNQSPEIKTDTLVISAGNNPNGIGRFKDIQLTHPLDETMIAKGEIIYNANCFSCHKITDEKLVGPGWKGVTDRRSAEWIMNFITNTQVMLDKDLTAQAMLVTCLIRMPITNLTDDEARTILEFMRKNDGKK